MVNDINDKSSRHSFTFHLSFFAEVQVTVFWISDVCHSFTSDDLNVRSVSEGGFYSSQAAQKLLEISYYSFIPCLLDLCVGYI